MIAAVVLALAVDAESMARSFTRALSADSTSAFRAIAAEENLDTTEWFSVREVIERYRCPVITSSRVVATDGNTIRVDIDGTATTENARRATRPLPQRWILETDGAKLRHAMTVEQWAAQQFVDATADEVRERIVDEYSADGGADMAAAIHEIGVMTCLASSHTNRETMLRVAPNVIEALSFLAELRHRANDPAGEAQAFRYASTCARLTSDVPAAVRWGEMSLLVATAANDCDAIANAQSVLGEALRVSGSREAGLALIRAAAYGVDALDDPRIAIRAAHNYATFAARQEDYRESMRAADMALQKTVEYGWSGAEGGAWSLLGSVHGNLGDYDAAEPYFRRAFALLHESGNRSWAAAVLANIGDMQASRGDYAQAVVTFDRALQLAAGDQRFFAGIIGVHAEALMAMNRLDEAECLLDSTTSVLSDVSVSSTNGDSVTYWRTATELSLRQGRFDEALHSADTVRAISPESPSGFTALARVLRAVGRDTEARMTLEEGITHAETARAELTGDALRRSSFFSTYTDIYYELADLLHEERRSREALVMTEHVKARAIADALAHGRDDMRGATTASERALQEELERGLRAANHAYLLTRTRGGDVATAERALDHARLALDRFQSELALRNGQRLPNATTRVELDLAGVLPSDDLAVLSYSVGREATLVFAITRDSAGNVSVDTTRIPITRERLASTVEEVVTSIANRRLDYARGARAMYDLLVAPVVRHIPATATLCIIPDGVLWELPFHALVDRAGRPLIARQAVFYAPSLTMLQNAQRQQKEPRPASLLAFGDPRFDARVVRERATTRGIDLAPLPDTKHEVREIARLYRNSAVYTGTDAAEKRFKDEAPRHGVLHLATHGVLHDRWPLYSALLLTATDGEDGVVEAREILELDLDADLAVLSACDTARGRIGAGEGVIGMSWALMMAGCRSTVVSQWKAASASTAELMIAFHRELAVGGRTKAEALRRAQLALRTKPEWRHPFYWAPFIVMGGGG